MFTLQFPPHCFVAVTKGNEKVLVRIKRINHFSLNGTKIGIVHVVRLHAAKDTWQIWHHTHMSAYKFPSSIFTTVKWRKGRARALFRHKCAIWCVIKNNKGSFVSRSSAGTETREAVARLETLSRHPIVYRQQQRTNENRLKNGATINFPSFRSTFIFILLPLLHRETDREKKLEPAICSASHSAWRSFTHTHEFVLPWLQCYQKWAL